MTALSSRPPRAIRPAAGVISVLSVMALSACGGGGDSQPLATNVASAPLAPAAPSAPETTQVRLYITDNFALEHEAVWLTINRISALNSAGETRLVSYDSGLVVNVPTLRRTGAWLGNVTLPTDAHTIRVYVEPNAQLQSIDGSMKTATLVTEGGYISIPLNDWDHRSQTLAVDFDLPNFLLQGDVLTIATRIANESDQQAWTRRHAEIKGQVTAIDQTGITLQSAHHGTLRAALDANTTFRANTANWTPEVGTQVTVDALKSASGNLRAQSVSATPWFMEDNLVDIAGTITSVRGTDITLEVTESTSTALLGQTRVQLAGAQFTRGSLESLQSSQAIEAYVKPMADGRWQAALVEVQGARKNGSEAAEATAAENIELAGQLTDINLTADTISLLGVTVRLDARTRLLDDLTDRPLALNELRLGDFIEVYGVRGSSTSTWFATLIERERAIGVDEAEGRASNVSGNSFSIGGVRVMTSAATRFEDNDRFVNATDFFARAAGQRVEVEGRWDGQALIASLAEIYPSSTHTNDDGRSQTGHADSDYAEVKGIVRSRNGDTVVLDVVYAEYVANVGNGSQFEVNLAGAYFARGALECLRTGAPVELTGYIDSTGSFRVVRVELEGYCGNTGSADRSSGVSGPIEVEGTITTLGANQFQISVFHIEDWNGSRPSTLTVTYDSNTVFRFVTPEGLRSGMFVDIYGSLTDGAVKATRIELD